MASLEMLSVARAESTGRSTVGQSAGSARYSGAVVAMGLAVAAVVATGCGTAATSPRANHPSPVSNVVDQGARHSVRRRAGLDTGGHPADR